MQSVFHLFNLAHHEMRHFVSTIHNYIMVEVLESAWSVFKAELSSVGDLDELLSCQRRFVKSILDKALLNETNNELSRQLSKVLNQVYAFTYKKMQFFFPSAEAEFERQNQQYPGGDILADQSHVSRQTVEQMKQHHAEFLRCFASFKVMLGEQP